LLELVVLPVGMQMATLNDDNATDAVLPSWTSDPLNHRRAVSLPYCTSALTTASSHYTGD